MATQSGSGMGSVAAPKRLRQLVEAVLTLSADLDLTAMLKRIIESAVDLVDATHGALGVLDDTGRSCPSSSPSASARTRTGPSATCPRATASSAC